MRKLIVLTTHTDDMTHARVAQPYIDWATRLGAALGPRDVVLVAHDDLPVRHQGGVVRFLDDGRKVYAPDGREASWRADGEIRNHAVGAAVEAWRAKGGATFHVEWNASPSPFAGRVWPHLAHAPFAEYTPAGRVADPDDGTAWPWEFGTRDYVGLDTETAGKVPGRHPILEVAAVRTNRALQVLDAYEARIPLDRSRPHEEEALRVNGYYERDWSDARSLEEAMRGLLPFLAREPAAVGHVLGFDLDMIGVALDECDLPHPPLRDRIDTCVMARRMLQKVGRIPNAKLDTVCAHLGVSNAGHHAALPDTLRCLAVFGKMRALDAPPADAAADAP